MKKTILIADDSENDRYLLSLRLDRDFPRYEVESFSDGESLDKRLNQELDNVSAVITDHQMPPGMIDGLEITKRHGLKLKKSNIPLILYHGGDRRIGEQAKRNGAYDYVIKAGDKKIQDVLKKALRHKAML